MFRFVFLYFVFFIVLPLSNANNRNDSLIVSAEWSGVAASNIIQPLWQYANKWGVYSPFDKSESVLRFDVNYRIYKTAHFQLDAGVGAVVKNLADESFLQQAFISGKAWIIDFEAGMRQFTPIAVDDKLTSGSFLMSSNARSVPKVGLGFFDFVTVPFTASHIGVKGGIYQGWLLNDNNDRSTKDVWLHEKIAYIRWQKYKLKPYAGLVHSALYGGTLPNGVKIPRDFWPTFKASGSSRIGGGEETNAAGAHMGLWDFGVDYADDLRTVKLYYQKPFADGSGMRINDMRNRDHVLGAYYRINAKKPLSAISMEWVKTDYQSGEGIPDAIDPETGQGIWPGTITDKNYKDWMANRFPEVNVDGWSRKDVFKYLADQWNYGYKFGGRDSPMNNGMYYQGWTHKGMSTGTSLFHTSQMVALYAPRWKQANQMNFVNNRVIAAHIGAEGYVNTDLKWTVKYTASWNKGSYQEKYVNRYSWVLSDDYFFENKKIQYFSLIRLDHNVGMRKNVNIFASLAYDFGDLYHSFGGQIGIKYNLGYL